MRIPPQIVDLLEPRPLAASLAIGAAALATLVAAVAFRVRGRVPGRALVAILAADAIVLLAAAYAGFRFRIAVEGTGDPIDDPPVAIADAAIRLAHVRAAEIPGVFIERRISIAFLPAAAGEPGGRPRIRVAYAGLAGPRAASVARGSALRIASEIDAIVRIAWLGAAASERDALRALRWTSPSAPAAYAPRIREALAGIRARFRAEAVQDAADALARALRIEG